VNIGKLGAHTAELIANARAAGNGALVLAGDDTASVGVVSGLQQSAPGAALGIVWFDAHGDFNTPETTFSGILAGMPLAIIAGYAGPLWREAARMAEPVPTDRILIAGVRELDEKEEELLESTSVAIVKAEAQSRRRPAGGAIHSLHIDAHRAGARGVDRNTAGNQLNPIGR
jgi:arginase